jgi:hypothetical protein
MASVDLPEVVKPSLPVSLPWLSRPAPGGPGEVRASIYYRRRIKTPGSPEVHSPLLHTSRPSENERVTSGKTILEQIKFQRLVDQKCEG